MKLWFRLLICVLSCTVFTSTCNAALLDVTVTWSGMLNGGSDGFINEPWSGTAKFTYDVTGFVGSGPFSSGDIPLTSLVMSTDTIGGTTFSTANANVVGSYSNTGTPFEDLPNYTGAVSIGGISSGSQGKTDGTSDFLISVFDQFVESTSEDSSAAPVLFHFTHGGSPSVTILPSVIPEPGPFVLLGIASVGFLAVRWRRRSRRSKIAD